MKWIIQNNSSKEWPCYPLIKNYSKDYDSQPKELNFKLQAKSKHDFEFKLFVPSNFTEKFFTLNLSFLDPRKNEKFGDSMIAVIEVIYDDFKQSFDDMEDDLAYDQ